MISGPRVDIYVGLEKKHYRLPKLLLCHFSPFFDKCFNGPFKEAQTQKLELPDDNVDFFELLVEYMLHGKVEDTEILMNPNNDLIADKDHCIKFIAYVDKYGVGEASSMVEEKLQKILPWLGWTRISGSDVETVFRAVPVGHELRKMITAATLSFSAQGQSSVKFRKQELEVDGFAAELLQQMRHRGAF